MNFADRVAIISGAASGMGLLTAQRFAENGARVILTDINEDGVTDAAQRIRAQGRDAVGVRVDVRCYDEIEAAVALGIERYGRLDILLNSAGGCSSRVFGRSEPFHELDIEIIDWGLDVNLKGAVYFCHAVLGHMIRQERGVVINMGSVSGVEGSTSPDYSAAKMAMIGLTKSIALIGAPHGVRACCVSPGPVLTRPEMAKMKTRLGRAAEPEEITNLILYLCSDKAAFITGSNHMIDGGRTIGGPQ
jgi:NAD(P)-dependent dehydrogenase (short-subunit alcohol dehydrogenase family)